MQLFKLGVFCLLLLNFAVFCESGFVPTASEERNLEDCLLHRGKRNVCGSFRKILRQRRSRTLSKRTSYCKYTKAGRITKEVNELEPANEYLCALNDYKNSPHKTATDTSHAIQSIGSCSGIFNSIIPTWKEFLSEREYMSVIRSPIWQRRNGSVVTARFVVDDFHHGYIADDLKAVDIVIARSDKQDVEIYGKYEVKVSIKSKADVFVPIVHDSLQATCLSNKSRSFVVGFNNDGLQILSKWFSDGNDEIELTVLLNPLTQIIRANHGQNERYEEREFNIEEKVSAIILHLSNPNSGVPMAREMFYPAKRPRRQKRSTSTEIAKNCQREPYMVNYRENNAVILPKEFDLGECVGSCDEALYTNLNATNHALSMTLEKKKRGGDSANPEPTVCCIPISYKKLFYVTQDSSQRLMSTYADNMVTEYCGCR